jgi:hypothetical protein
LGGGGGRGWPAELGGNPILAFLHGHDWPLHGRMKNKKKPLERLASTPKRERRRGTDEGGQFSFSCREARLPPLFPVYSEASDRESDLWVQPQISCTWHEIGPKTRCAGEDSLLGAEHHRKNEEIWCPSQAQLPICYSVCLHLLSTPPFLGHRILSGRHMISIQCMEP